MIFVLKNKTKTILKNKKPKETIASGKEKVIKKHKKIMEETRAHGLSEKNIKKIEPVLEHLQDGFAKAVAEKPKKKRAQNIQLMKAREVEKLKGIINSVKKQQCNNHPSNYEIREEDKAARLINFLLYLESRNVHGVRISKTIADKYKTEKKKICINENTKTNETAYFVYDYQLARFFLQEAEKIIEEIEGETKLSFCNDEEKEYMPFMVMRKLCNKNDQLFKQNVNLEKIMDFFFPCMISKSVFELQLLNVTNKTVPSCSIVFNLHHLIKYADEIKIAIIILKCIEEEVENEKTNILRKIKKLTSNRCVAVYDMIQCDDTGTWLFNKYYEVIQKIMTLTELQKSPELVDISKLYIFWSSKQPLRMNVEIKSKPPFKKFRSEQLFPILQFIKVLMSLIGSELENRIELIYNNCQKKKDIPEFISKLYKLVKVTPETFRNDLRILTDTGKLTKWLANFFKSIVAPEIKMEADNSKLYLTKKLFPREETVDVKKEPIDEDKRKSGERKKKFKTSQQGYEKMCFKKMAIACGLLPEKLKRVMHFISNENICMKFCIENASNHYFTSKVIKRKLRQLELLSSKKSKLPAPRKGCYCVKIFKLALAYNLKNPKSPMNLEKLRVHNFMSVSEC